MTKVAIVEGDRACSYEDLRDASRRVAGALLDGADDLKEARVCFHIPPGFAHVAVRNGIWLAGGIAVPLAMSHPPPEQEYVIRDSGASIVVCHPERSEGSASASKSGSLAALRMTTKAVGARLLLAEDVLDHAPATILPAIAETRRAMMVYTSGTTGRPRGVISTHANIQAQVDSLIEAWGWRDTDRILLVLPLHHVHGIINVVECALRAGATCEMHPSFDADATWDALASGRLTLFMAVPTIYKRLIAAYDAADTTRQKAMRHGARNLRLMVSGSAALPGQTLERWREITGHVLLERYGMTELGMALSNPLHGERRPGFVGMPLPRVEVRRVDDAGAPVTGDDVPGELEVRGPNVFLEYWGKPDATREAFRDGWFRTGDMAVVDNGSYRLLGRSSVDILKTGGYKVSALEIEEVLREHPAIAECAVVGVADPEYGERVSAAIETRAGQTLTLNELVAWGKTRLAPYKVPRALRVVTALPRNAMGKVVKPDVVKLFA